MWWMLGFVGLWIFWFIVAPFVYVWVTGESPYADGDY